MGLAVGVPLAFGIAHALRVAPHYHVGSFDDDASYILAARALLAGHGLTSVLPGGAVLVGLYPPGYPSLLVPLLWLFGHGDVALRGLSFVCFAATFPLTWRYLGSRRLPDPVRIAVLLLLAASPVFATYASMVMAEAPFVVLFLVMLLMLERWEAARRAVPPVAVAAVVALAGLVWLKEAAVGMVAGVAVWLLLCRHVRRAVVAVVGSVALLAPVAAARLAAGVPLSGARYSQELGLYYHTGLLGRLHHVVGGLGTFLSTALPATVVPYGAPLPQSGFWAGVLSLLAWHVTLLCALGFVVWARHHRDAAVVVVPVYLAETLLWPFVNERRVVLVLPVILAWYALGAWTVGRAVLTGVRTGWPRRPRLASRVAPAGLCAVAALLAVVPLGRQWSRDYLFDVGQDSSAPAGSRYAAVLAGIGRPEDVVETDYRWTVALLSGHATADAAFIAELTTCDDAAATTALAGDNAAFLLLGALNKPGLMDNGCLLRQATSAPWSVRLLRTSRDLASVFELIGPGTGHPDLVDVTAGATVSASGPLTWIPVAPSSDGDNAGSMPATETSGGSGTLVWSWATAAAVRQVSVGEAGGAPAPATGVAVELRRPDGSWAPVAAAPASVGDLPGATPYLLASLPAATTATALRVVIQGTGQVSALDVHVLAERTAA